MCYAQPQIFVIECVFDIMQFDNRLQKLCYYNYRGSASLPTRVSEPSTHRAFICSKATIETQDKQGVSLVSLLLTLYILLVNSIEFKQVNAG